MNYRSDKMVIRLVAVLAIVTSAGCGIVASGDPENAMVELTGSDGADIKLVVSNDFSTQPSDDPDDGRSVIVNLNNSDTLIVQTPYSQAFTLGPRTRFFALALKPDEDGSVSATMRVAIDGDERYQSTRDLTAENGMEFIYVSGN